MMDFFQFFLTAKVAYAASRFDTFIGNVNKFVINPLIILLFALALVFFLYGVFEFILSAGNEEKRSTGKSHMFWGIVGLTIMIGVWSILGFIINTFDIKGINPEENKVDLPAYTPPSR